MAGANHQALLRRLKKQVKLLQRRDEKNRNKLRIVLMKMKKMGRVYKTKLAGRMRSMKSKVSEAQSSTYARVAADLERQMTKNLASKGKSLSAAITKLEKKNIAKWTKGLAKKGKKRKSSKGKVRQGTSTRSLRRNATNKNKRGKGKGTGLRRSRGRKRR